jgi:alpha-beta hydrolase superfamily lysophospholipase
VWTRPGATCTLLLVHGYFDHVGLYRHLIGHGLERGCDVVAFDLPGHGLSTGAEAETEDFDEYRCALRDVLLAVEPLPGPRYAIGQSTGGAVIMEYLYRDPPVPLDRIVLLAPLVRPCNWLQVRTAHALLHRFVDRIPRRFADNSQDAEFLAFVRTDPLQSRTISVKWIGALRRWLEDFRLRKPRTEAMLVVQGDADETVDWRYNIPRIRQLFPRARFHFVPGGRHHLANESADIRSDIYKVIDPYLFDSGGQS